MKFDLDEDRSLLKTSTRELLEKESPIAEARKVMEEAPHGWSKEVYAKLAELGYFGLTLSEDEGGSGLGVVGLAAVLHEMGRVALPGPFLDLVLAAETLRGVGGADARKALEAVTGGQQVVLLARAESVSGIEPATPATRFQAGRAKGTKRFVPYGAFADALLVTTTEGLVLVPRPAGGWSARALETLDHAQRFAEIDLDAPGTLLADAAATARVLEAVDRTAALGAAALLLGLMERALEISVAYLTERKAFGVPIGSFQALQHRASDLLLRVESSRAAVYRAAWAAENDPVSAPLLVAAAKAYCGDSARVVTGEAIQFFGGVGYTWEYDPHLYFKRTKTLEQFYGATRTQIEAALRAAGI